MRTIKIIPLSRKNLVNVGRNKNKTKCGTEGLNNFGKRPKSREDKGDREGIPHTHPVP